MTLHICVRDADLDGIKTVLANGTDIDVPEYRTQWTPLMSAVADASVPIDIARFLIEQGANVNALAQRPGGRASLRTFPLGLAVKSGNLEKTRLLLDHGADIRLGSETHSLVLQSALNFQSLDPIPMLKLLIEYGLDLHGDGSDSDVAVRMASYRGRFNVVRFLRDSGVSLESLQWTPLMQAVVFGTQKQMLTLLEDGESLHARDFMERTAWLLAVQVGDIEKAETLRIRGANLNDRGRFELVPLHMAVRATLFTGQADMLAYLLAFECDPNEVDYLGVSALSLAASNGGLACMRMLLAAGAHLEVDGQHAIESATTIESVRALLADGADLNQINTKMRATFVGTPIDEAIRVNRDEYLAGSQRRFGRTNPERMDVALWRNMVLTRQGPWAAQNAFWQPESSRLRDGLNDVDTPVPWSFYRYGISLNELPDGRFIEVGGAHEDFYDADFCIYNDVVVHDGNGRFNIYGYPKNLFPPTDYHSATLVGDAIYIIGGLGYPAQRNADETPVFRLDTKTLVIEKVTTSGECPGLIYRHRARSDGPRIRVYGGQRQAIVDGHLADEDNQECFELDLITLIWEKQAQYLTEYQSL